MGESETIMPNGMGQTPKDRCCGFQLPRRPTVAMSTETQSRTMGARAGEGGGRVSGGGWWCRLHNNVNVLSVTELNFKNG